MRYVSATVLALLLLVQTTVGNATSAVVGGDEGHKQIASETADDCAFSPYLSTPTISCSKNTGSTGQNLWQIALPVSAASSTTTTVTASAIAQVPVTTANPNQIVSGRLLSWDTSGTLLCATSFVSWGQSASPLSKSLGSCFSVNPTTNRPEAEFSVGHVNGQALSLMPRVYSVSYSY